MTTTPLIDEVMPEYQFGNCYSIDVPVTVPQAFAAAETYSMDASWGTSLLFWLRGLPVPRTIRGSLVGLGFTILGERPDEEVVAGIAGRFWALREVANLIPLPDRDTFVRFAEPGTAKAAASLRFAPLGPREARVTTETRVWCADAYRRFQVYWFLIKPFSGWIRRDMLRRMRAHIVAEVNAHAQVR
jgi:hypothetical protein